ncbi:eukaryotic integral membrane protein-domain-containing protein [Usnea florida]
MQMRINIPPLTRVLLALVLAISIAHQITRYLYGGLDPELLALIPQWSLFYPWVYFTATFAEQNVVTLLIAGATILYGGKYLERAWGSTEFGKFVLLVTVLPNFLATLVYVLWFAITRDESRALAFIQGSVALQGAFLVAFKQLVPEHTVTILRGVIKIRVKHFPAIFLVANTISGLVIGTDTALVLGWMGFITSWTYLRFYKKQVELSGASTGGPTIKGDASETFAFAYFWPDVVQPPIAAVADGVYNALVAIRVITPFSAEEVETSNVQATVRGEGGLPSLLNQGAKRGGGGKREEAERRRALALKALDQRLHAATSNKQQQASAPPPAPISQEVSTSNTEPPAESTPS